MNTLITMLSAMTWPQVRRTAAAGVLLAGVFLAFAQRADVPGAAGEPYPSIPQIAPIGAHIAKYREVPESAKGLGVRFSNSPITGMRTNQATSSSRRPRKGTLMAVDVISPGWMPWRRLSLAEAIPATLHKSKRSRSSLLTSWCQDMSHARAPKPIRNPERFHERSKDLRQDAP